MELLSRSSFPVPCNGSRTDYYLLSFQPSSTGLCQISNVDEKTEFEALESLLTTKRLFKNSLPAPLGQHGEGIISFCVTPGKKMLLLMLSCVIMVYLCTCLV